MIEQVITVRLRLPDDADVMLAERTVRDALTSAPLLTGTVYTVATTGIENI